MQQWDPPWSAFDAFRLRVTLLAPIHSSLRGNVVLVQVSSLTLHARIIYREHVKTLEFESCTCILEQITADQEP